ncbi:MAG: serine hydrolase, partial [Prevotella sp.]|nr:serine hydrolase [Prevotella sp.]
ERFGRALGWDVYSGYASDGDIFDVSAYGHTGYTGTSITIDPESDTAVILLTNRVHPEDKGAVSRLREVVANVVAASITDMKL